MCGMWTATPSESVVRPSLGSLWSSKCEGISMVCGTPSSIAPASRSSPPITLFSANNRLVIRGDRFDGTGDPDLDIESTGSNELLSAISVGIEEGT